MLVVLNRELGRDILRPIEGSEGLSSLGGLGRSDCACIEGVWWMSKPMGRWWISVEAVVERRCDERRVRARLSSVRLCVWNGPEN